MSKSVVDYYKVPRFYWFLLIDPAMIFITLSSYMPHKMPFQYLSIIGSLTKYLVTNYPTLFRIMVWSAWGAHFLEAVYVVYLCCKLNMSFKCTVFWFGQTFLLGFPSTSIIKHYYNKKQDENENNETQKLTK